MRIFHYLNAVLSVEMDFQTDIQRGQHSNYTDDVNLIVGGVGMIHLCSLVILAAFQHVPDPTTPFDQKPLVTTGFTLK